MQLEGTLEMRLVGKPGGQGHIGDQLAIAQLAAGKLDALVDQKRMGRQPTILLERADQIRRRQLRGEANVLKLQGLGAVQCSRM